MNSEAQSSVANCRNESRDYVDVVVVPNLPADVIGRSIGSFLDRLTFNALRQSCKEVSRCMEGMKRPWPIGKFAVGKKLGVQSLAFSPDGNTLACRSRGGLIQIFHRDCGKILEWHCPAPFGFGNLTFSPDGQVLACDNNGRGGRGCIKLYDIHSGKRVGVSHKHQESITSAVFFSSSTRENRPYLASGSKDATIRLWDRFSSNEVAELQGHSGPIYSMALSSDGRCLASGGSDQILRIWDLQKVLCNDQHNFCQDLVGHEMTIVDVAFSDQILVSASLDCSVRLWRPVNSQDPSGMRRESKRRFIPKLPDYSCYRILRLEMEALSVRFTTGDSRKTTLAVALADETISVWKMEELETKTRSSDIEISPPEPDLKHSGRVFSLAKDGTLAVTSGKEGCIRLEQIRI